MDKSTHSVRPANLAEDKPPTEKELALNQIQKIFGDSGTRRYSGYFMEEYNSVWREEQRVNTVEEMRRSDADVRAALRAIEAPILATRWSVTTKATDAKAEEIRAFVQSNLFNLRRTWKQFLREALKFLAFGHYAFELVWTVKDGKVYLTDLAPRIPRSIARWKLTDGSFGIVQVLQTDEAEESMAEIPGDKLLIFTNDKEGDDVTGQSVLRSAYKHFVYKDLLYKIQGISAERFGVGIPVITMADTAGSDEKDDAEDMGANIRSNEKGYIVLPNKEWTVEIMVPNGNPQGQQITEMIEHHSKKILHTVLASFLSLGSDGVGSYALSADQSSFFLKVDEDMAHYMAEEINRQVIKKLVDLNYGPQEIYPELTFARLGDIDYGEMSQTILTLVQAGMVRPGSRMMTWVRDNFGLPEMTADELEAEQEHEIAEEVEEIDEKPEAE